MLASLADGLAWFSVMDSLHDQYAVASGCDIAVVNQRQIERLYTVGSALVSILSRSSGAAMVPDFPLGPLFRQEVAAADVSLAKFPVKHTGSAALYVYYALCSLRVSSLFASPEVRVAFGGVFVLWFTWHCP
jgi:hypothetical protein